jgi:3-vinyl bacteriochlorophyllide hydratase
MVGRSDAQQTHERGPRSGGVGAASVSLAGLLDDLIEMVAPSPWSAHAGHLPFPGARRGPDVRRPLYTMEERLRRDASPWTMVQALMAPLQFLVFAVSLGLVIRYLVTGAGYEIATISILAKTAALYTIMITGSIWEKQVFGKWLFARAFFWEDVFSMLVLGLQTAYVGALLAGIGSPRQQMAIAIAAYAAYIINATQFLLKLRAARREGQAQTVGVSGRMGHVA